MNDARASHINAKQGTIRAVNKAKLNTKSCKYEWTKCFVQKCYVIIDVRECYILRGQKKKEGEKFRKGGKGGCI
jgi:hypothetical protein